VKRRPSTDRARYTIHRPGPTDLLVPATYTLVVILILTGLPPLTALAFLVYTLYMAASWFFELRRRHAFFAFLDIFDGSRGRESAYEFTLTPGTLS
jgi:hypothetical protein